MKLEVETRYMVQIQQSCITYLKLSQHYAAFACGGNCQTMLPLVLPQGKPPLSPPPWHILLSHFVCALHIKWRHVLRVDRQENEKTQQQGARKITAKTSGRGGRSGRRVEVEMVSDCYWRVNRIQHRVRCILICSSDPNRPQNMAKIETANPVAISSSTCIKI